MTEFLENVTRSIHKLRFIPASPLLPQEIMQAVVCFKSPLGQTSI